MEPERERRIALLASALEEAQATIKGKIDELSLLREVADAICQHRSVEALSFDLVNTIAESFNCKYTVMYAAGEDGAFGLQAVSNVFFDHEQFPQSITGTRAFKFLCQHRTPCLIRTLDKAPEWTAGWPFPGNLESWLCFPLADSHVLHGLLLLADEHPNAFDEEDLRTLMIVAPQITSALSNIGLYNELRASEAKYRQLVEGLQDVVYICDNAWNILDMNAAALTMFKDIPVGSPLNKLFLDRDCAAKFVETVRQTGSARNFEAELKKHGGDKIVALISCVSDGERHSGVIKDVTERASLVEQVVRAQKMESIGTLASGVAHDFNNILGIILPNAELIANRGRNDPTIARLSEVIVKASQRAASLTRQLLGLARHEAKDMKPLDLNDSVRSTGKLLSETLNRNIRVDLDLAEDLRPVRADETQMVQVLLNLAINARDAMPAGGEIRFKSRSDGDDVVLTVSDTGTGMDRDTLRRIFDPFFTTKEKGRGTGLGLSVVYNVVKQHRGTIDVRSETGKGTEFILRFPTTGEAIRKPSASSERPLSGTEKILVVDDEAEMLFLLEFTLRKLGYQVVTAQNGAQALERLTDDVALMITDVIMPVMDGITSLRFIRNQRRDLKVIAASGCSSPEKRLELEHLGINGFISKPFDLLSLSRTVRDVLDAR